MALQTLLTAKNDTAKVNQLIKYADKLTDCNAKQALLLLLKIVKLSNHLHYPNGTGAALYLLGYVHNARRAWAMCMVT
ncbi:hypothetical protein [Adhaeribacter pallidiroseus]|uniref:Uncharacterized protein n=1 Tax=Adhaeribacter pallidiroseus TaxID=2072847 RepID=A0A369QDY2_9BACT|nr:hypothetical protein [Adhaeribacter pallidiroseus]RDC63133.1 hypothetical protein AHMF7616_01733 [Adhaeribacter pallidiroseus]